MDENDLDRIRNAAGIKDKYLILKESIKKGDRETESFVRIKLSEIENDPIRKHLIMALRLLETDSALEIALKIASTYEIRFEELSRDEKEFFSVAIWTLFGYMSNSKVIDFLIHLFNKNQTKIKSEITKLIRFENEEILTKFGQNLIPRIDNLNDNIKNEIIFILSDNMDKIKIKKIEDMLFKIITKRLKDIYYNAPKDLILALIYIGNKNSCNHLKQIAEQYRKGEIQADSFWNDTLYGALHRFCSNLGNEFDDIDISGLRHVAREMSKFREV